MKMRAGIVGPADMVEFICEIANESNQTISTVPFVYREPKDTTEIINNNHELVDVWIFSGPGIFPFAKKSRSNQLFFYLKMDGFSLTKTMMEIGYKNGKSLNMMSIDFLTDKDVKETYKDLGIPFRNVSIKAYSPESPLEDYLTFHESLYVNRKTDTCVTALHFIYEELKKKGIPVYRILPTRSNIRETLRTAYQKWETHHSRQSQIAIVFIKIDKETNKEKPSYDMNRLDLEMQEFILDFAEDVSGSFVQMGVGTFIIFTTRGALNEKRKEIGMLLDKCELFSDVPANIGIGYGESALAAEENARLALYYGQNYGPFCAFLVDANRVIEGPLNEQKKLGITEASIEEETARKLKRCGVSASTFRKIVSLQKQMENQSVTALDVSTWLKMTQRNARRILMGLVNGELASVIGTEATDLKGRPRNIYRITVE
ncbi:hypothetical protein ABES25_17195 [Bacillus gobiensis]|uniref:hypothetical protein n=1 Tax=Bacillus gobiensis TaxID=1441095 RepID=UPI003D1962FE